MWKEIHIGHFIIHLKIDKKCTRRGNYENNIKKNGINIGIDSYC